MELCLVVWIADTQLVALDGLLFYWLASLSIMLIVVGCLNFAVWLGALVLVGTMVLGMGTGVIPYELLPAFWQDWVYPWAPQRLIGLGIREMLFMNATAWNNAAGQLTLCAIIGAIALCLSPFVRRGNQKRESVEVLEQ
jgi:hypothetical protein